MCEFIPPFSVVPSCPSSDADTVIISVREGRLIEIKDVKKLVIIEDVDRRRM